jgi:hypothetical protein
MIDHGNVTKWQFYFIFCDNKNIDDDDDDDVKKMFDDNVDGDAVVEDGDVMLAWMFIGVYTLDDA